MLTTQYKKFLLKENQLSLFNKSNYNDEEIKNLVNKYSADIMNFISSGFNIPALHIKSITLLNYDIDNSDNFVYFTLNIKTEYNTDNINKFLGKPEKYPDFALGNLIKILFEKNLKNNVKFDSIHLSKDKNFYFYNMNCSFSAIKEAVYTIEDNTNTKITLKTKKKQEDIK